MLKHALVEKMFKNVHKMFLIMCFSSICIFSHNLYSFTYTVKTLNDVCCEFVFSIHM